VFPAFLIPRIPEQPVSVSMILRRNKKILCQSKETNIFDDSLQNEQQFFTFFG